MNIGGTDAKKVGMWWPGDSIFISGRFLMVMRLYVREKEYQDATLSVLH